MSTPAERFRDDDTETALLGARIADPAISGILRALVTADDFGSSAHGLVWSVCDAIEAKPAPIDLAAVCAELLRRDRLGVVSERINMDALPFMRVAVPRAEHYASIVAGNARARRLAKELHRSLLKLETATNATAFADDVAMAIATTATKRTRAKQRTLIELACDYSDHVRQVRANRGKVTGLRTGIAELDRRTGGLRPEQLIVIAARPAMGKTSLAIGKIAVHVARHEGKRVAAFSLEMGDMELWERMVCDEASVDSTRVHNGEMSDEDCDRIDVASAALAQIPLTIIDQGGMRVEDIRGECVRMRETEGLDLIVIDALGLMEHGTRNGASESTLLGVTTRRLKALAKELRIPIILLVQLNRKCEDEKRRPQMSDLRDSGHIEQDADCVWLIYRDEVYNGTIERDVPKVDRHGNAIEVDGKPVLAKRANKNRAEIIVAKQRGGRTGTIHVQFDAQFTRFANLEREVLPAEIPYGYPADVPPDDNWQETA